MKERKVKKTQLEKNENENEKWKLWETWKYEIWKYIARTYNHIVLQ